MQSMIQLISTLIGIYTTIILLRVWLQVARADFYNPLSQFVVKATHFIVGPLRRVIPSLGGWDIATLLFAYVLSCIQGLIPALLMNGAFDPMSVLIYGLVNLITSAYYLLFGCLILRVILSWISQGQNPIEHLIIQLTEPLLAPIRKIIPPMGGLDLSMLVLILGLQFISNLILEMFHF